MRTLLISANTEQINMPVLPMGLASVATAAGQAGHEVELLNLMTKGDLVEFKLENAVLSFRPEIIGVSVRNIDDQVMKSPKFLLEAVKNVVRSCRGLTSVPIVLGGAGFSIYPGSVLAYLEADMGIRGEGEAAFVELLDRLSRKETTAGVSNLILPGSARESGLKTVRNLDELPLPAPDGFFSLPAEFQNQKVWLPFQTRRGCPMGCSYCSTATIEGRILRKRSPAIVVESIARFAEAGFGNLFFVDNTFNFPSSYALELCGRMIGKNLRIQWQGILYPWKVDEKLIERMAEAGCVSVALGFESGSKKILRALNKRFRPEEVRRISQMLRRHGISRMGFLLLGGPGETRETVEESLEFADSLELESVKLTAGIRIYPDTVLAEIARAEGVVAVDDDLLRPKFYLAGALEGWIDEKVAYWLKKRPNWLS